jgi:predicted transcriptional regulator
LDYRVFHDTTERLIYKQLIRRTESDGAVTFQITDAGVVVLELMDNVQRWSDEHPVEATLLGTERQPGRPR